MEPYIFDLTFNLILLILCLTIINTVILVVVISAILGDFTKGDDYYYEPEQHNPPRT